MSKYNDSRDSLQEEFGRGIPQFAIEQLAEETRESASRFIRNFINTTSKNPVEVRQRMSEATQTLDELQEEIAEILQNHLMSYMRKFLCKIQYN